MAAVVTAPGGDIDLWAPVERDALPKALVEAMERRDWSRVRDQLGTVMDGMTTDGAYGRALLQLALELPIGVDPIFDSYRGAHRSITASGMDLEGAWPGVR